MEQLEKVAVSQMEINSRLAFWINVYNALVMHVKVHRPDSDLYPNIRN